MTKIDAEHGASRRVWIRPPKRFPDEIVAKGSVAVGARLVAVGAPGRHLAWSLPLISISELAAHL